MSRYAWTIHRADQRGVPYAESVTVSTRSAVST